MSQAIPQYKPSLCFKAPIHHQTQVIQSDQLLRELSGADQWNRVSYLSSCVVVELKQIGSGPSAKTKRQMVWKAHLSACPIIMGTITLRRYGVGVLAGTHSATYSCAIPSLSISSTPTDSKRYWKTHQKQFGFRAFCNSALKFCNALPQTIREADSSATFYRRPKSHLFSDWMSFSVSARLDVHRNFSMSSQDCFYVSL